MAKIAKTIDFVKLPFPLILKRTYLSLSLSPMKLALTMEGTEVKGQLSKCSEVLKPKT
jgi:hypothetical protein